MFGSDRVAKYAFLAAISFACLGGAFLYGVVAQRDNLTPLRQLREARDLLKDGIPDLSPDVKNHVQPARGQGQGVVRNTTNSDALVLMVGFFDEENQARLVQRDGTVQAKWSLNYFDHFPETERGHCSDVTSPLGVDVHGALLTPEGELVFNYEYCGTVKLDRCGVPLWTLADATHHSLVPAESGGYWLLGRDEWRRHKEPDRFPPFSSGSPGKGIKEDTLLRIAEDGEVLNEFSIPMLMLDGGLGPLLTATGDNFTHEESGRSELVHANKVTELSSELAGAYPLFRAGDLAISMRELNLLMVVDPATGDIKWHQTGPWIRQHDPEFRHDGRISVFNNNVYRNAYRNDLTILSTPFSTNIIAVDPVSRVSEVIFGEKPGQEMLSVIRGQHELLPDGGILIAEFDAGRVLEVDSEGRVVWEYVNHFNDKYVGEITNAAVYPREYFKSVPSVDSCQ